MSLEDQIYAQALMMAGDLDREQDALLRILCQASIRSLEGQLRSGITPEDCRADFIAAGSLYALAALSEADKSPERFTAGELTVQRSGGGAAANCLRRQAELMMAPYVRDGFAFLGV